MFPPSAAGDRLAAQRRAVCHQTCVKRDIGPPPNWAEEPQGTFLDAACANTTTPNCLLRSVAWFAPERSSPRQLRAPSRMRAPNAARDALAAAPTTSGIDVWTQIASVNPFVERALNQLGVDSVRSERSLYARTRHSHSADERWVGALPGVRRTSEIGVGGCALAHRCGASRSLVVVFPPGRWASFLVIVR